MSQSAAGRGPDEIAGRYEVVQTLGAGAFGTVYKAKDRVLGRMVAIKTIRFENPAGSGASRTDLVSRFKREAMISAQLKHPNIVTIHDISEFEGMSYLAMEFIDGVGLDRDLAAAGRLPVERAAALGAQIAEALDFAHRHGVVHRDVKPANIMIEPGDRVKVTDFGIARMSNTADNLTATGSLLGTPAYMSPEQARGEVLDGRSDLFSLGCILYEMVAGQKAFAGDSLTAVLLNITTGEPPPLRDMEPTPPEAIVRIVARALAKSPEARYQSGRELADDLLALARPGTTPVSRPPEPDPTVVDRPTRAKTDAPSAEDVKRLLRDTASGAAAAAGSGRVSPALSSRRGLVVGAVVAVLALVLGGVWLPRRGSDAVTPPTHSSASGPKRMAVLPFENLGAAEDGYFADGMTDEVRSKLAGLPDLAVIASTSTSQYKGTTKLAEQIAKELGVGYLLVAKVRWQKSGQASRIRLTPELVEVGGGAAPTTRWQEAYEADLSDVFRVQGEIATKVAQSLEVALSGRERGRLTARPTSNLAAYDAYLKGQEIEKGGGYPATLRGAAAQYEQAVALDPGFALAWARLSVSHSEIYRYGTPSPKEAEAARKAAQRAMELAPNLPEAYVALGDYYRLVENDSEKAGAAYARGLNVAPDDALLLRVSASVERNLGRLEEALAHLRGARDLDPRSWEGERDLGLTLLLLRRTGEAREAFDRGLALAPANISLIHAKAVTFLQGGDLAGARAALAATPKEVEPTALVAFFANYDDLDWVLDDARSDVLLRLTPAAFDGDRGTWGIVLAQASARRGDQAKAREYAEEARKAFAAQVAEVPQDAQGRVFFGLAMAYLGRKAEAVREGERGVAPLPIAKDSPVGKYLQHQLVRIHILVGNHEKALDLLEPLLKVPYCLTPGWLRIDPNFDPLRGNPRFEKLARGT